MNEESDQKQIVWKNMIKLELIKHNFRMTEPQRSCNNCRHSKRFDTSGLFCTNYSLSQLEDYMRGAPKQFKVSDFTVCSKHDYGIGVIRYHEEEGEEKVKALMDEPYMTWW
jgi:hypothetical protein